MTIYKDGFAELKNEVKRRLPDWINVEMDRENMTIEFEAVIAAKTSRSITDCAKALTGDAIDIGQMSKQIRQQLTSTMNDFFVEQHETFGVYGPKPEVEYDKAISVLRDKLYSGACQIVEGSTNLDPSKVRHAEAVDALETVEKYLEQKRRKYDERD